MVALSELAPWRTGSEVRPDRAGDRDASRPPNLEIDQPWMAG
jgi:hypothetical protein